MFNKLGAEVLRLDSRDPSFEEIKEMKYLQYCLNESLRLYPMHVPFPLHPKVILIDSTYLGVNPSSSVISTKCSSVPINGRVAVKDTVLPLGGGPDGKSLIFIKAGTQVNYQVYSMHRRKDLYGKDADEFKPERWESMRQG